MKQWTKEIEINAPIEHVWQLLNGSLEANAKNHATGSWPYSS